EAAPRRALLGGAARAAAARGGARGPRGAVPLPPRYALQGPAGDRARRPARVLGGAGGRVRARRPHRPPAVRGPRPAPPAPLDRGAATLSGGEGQRIRLATQIGSKLVGVLYILDEPSIGLHQRDNARLLATLRQLRDLGNTVVVVEHDRDTILAADHVIDMGP